MPNKQRHCGQLQNHLWIANFRRSNWKITMFGKSVYLFVVLWHGGSCKEVCGAILWVGEQDDSATLQSIYSMYRWPPLQRRRNEICWRIVTCMFSNCSKNAYNWHVLDDPIFYGQWTSLHDQSQNGPKHVTNDYLVWSLTFIIHVITSNFVMWKHFLCIFGSHTFVPTEWMCKKQTSVSHSSTETEVISLDAGLRMDGIPALDLWDLIVTVLGNTHQNDQVRGDPNKSPTRKKDWWSEQCWICFLKREFFS